MNFNGSYHFEKNMQDIWESLNNPEVLKKCISGCEELKGNISEELVGTRDDTDDPMHAVEDYRWLADIRNNNNSHIVNLSYLVKVKGE